MTIFRNFKNQSAFYNHHASRMSIKEFEILFKTLCTTFKKDTCVYQSQITNTFKFEVISESKYGQYKIKCLQNSFKGSL